MSKKHYVLTGLAMLLVAFLIFNVIPEKKSSMDKIYDDNEWIAGEGDSYTYLFRVATKINNKSQMKFNMSGMETLWEIEASKDNFIDIEYSSKISRGNFKVVLISPDNNLQTVFEGTGEGTIRAEILEGVNRIKVVGKNAKGSINIILISNESNRISSWN